MVDSRLAMVTGANRGLGLEISRQLAQKGLGVVLTARSGDAAEEAAKQLTKEGLNVRSHQLDVTDLDNVKWAVGEIIEREGAIDVLINNAGIAIDKGQKAASPDFEAIRRTLDTNVLGAWHCCAAVIPQMLARGYGRIVNITSYLGSITSMGDTNVSYRVSKAGLNALTRVLASELEDSGILVNAASPGRMNTRMARNETTRTPEEGADTPVWLATLAEDGPTGCLFYERKPLDW